MKKKKKKLAFIDAISTIPRTMIQKFKNKIIVKNLQELSIDILYDIFNRKFK